MVAFAINQAMQSTLTNSGSDRNIIFLGAGSEESIERSEIALGTDEILNASLGGIGQVMNQSAVSPEVHYNGMVETKKK
jgi:putative ABC transport system permease protein